MSMFLIVGQTYRIEIPGIVRQPLLRPAPVVIATGLSIAKIKGNTVFVVQPRSDAVDDRAWRTGVFVRAEKHVGRIALAAAHQHAGVVRVAAEYPVQLIPCVIFKLRAER